MAGKKGRKRKEKEGKERKEGKEGKEGKEKVEEAEEVEKGRKSPRFSNIDGSPLFLYPSSINQEWQNYVFPPYFYCLWRGLENGYPIRTIPFVKVQGIQF